MKDENFHRIEFSTRFNQRKEKIPTEVIISLLEALELFEEDPNNPQLRNHALRGRYVGFRSIDITDDYRALFKIRKTKKETIAVFHTVGTHAQLYGKI